jgi:hypothetical protein
MAMARDWVPAPATTTACSPFAATATVWRRPLLVGLAYRCQRLDHIELGRHDVPIDAVVTEDGVAYLTATTEG